MKTQIAVACFVALVAFASAQAPAAAGAKYGSKAVTRVITLLEDLKKRISDDAKVDQKVYDKYGCWCVTNAGEKADAIAHVKAQLQQLGAQVLASKGGISTLTGSIAELTENLKGNEQAMHDATKIRQRENENYVAEKAETESAIGALSKALQVLDIAQGGHGALLGGSALIEQVKMAVQSKATTEQLAALDHATEGGYVPASSSIQSILQDMYETFAHDLQSTSDREHTLQASYDEFLGSKQTELQSLQDTILKKEGEKGDAETSMADATRMYDDAEKQLEADIVFFDASKASCSAKAAEWTERQAVRSTELDGITKALSILTDDSAQYLFGRSMKDEPSFMQVDQEMDGNSGPAKAFKTIQQAAKKSHSMRLAALAADVRMTASRYTPPNGHFDLIGAAIDKLVKEIEQEQLDDNARTDACVGELHGITKVVTEFEFKISNNVAELNKIEALIKEKTTEKKIIIEELEKVEKDITDLNSTRAVENTDYLAAKADDQQAIELLTSAKTALMQYYNQQSAEAALIQQHQDPPSAEFKTLLYRHNDAKGVEGVIELIIQDLSGEISSADAAEASAVASYDTQLAAATALQTDLQHEVTDLDNSITFNGEEKVRVNDVKTVNEGELQAQKNTEIDIRPRCDFLINGKDKRRSKRDAEMDALKQAFRFLKGAGSRADRDALLQKSPSFLQKRA